MIDSARLGGVGRVRSAGAAESVVERDRGGQREEALAEADSEAVQGAGAVAFEAEEVFAGPEDRLDALTDRGQVWPAAGFVFAHGADDVRVERCDGGGEVATGVAAATSRSSDLGEVSDSARGVPSRANRACRRKPQK